MNESSLIQAKSEYQLQITNNNDTSQTTVTTRRNRMTQTTPTAVKLFQKIKQPGWLMNKEVQVFRGIFTWEIGLEFAFNSSCEPNEMLPVKLTSSGGVVTPNP